jgi:hypothetical protein
MQGNAESLLRDVPGPRKGPGHFLSGPRGRGLISARGVDAVRGTFLLSGTDNCLDCLCMRELKQITALVFAGLLLTACGNGDGSQDGADASGCQDAVASAAESGDLRDDVNLQPAFEACDGLAEFGAAVMSTPEALEEIGSDVEGWARERCQESDALSGSALCEAFQ